MTATVTHNKNQLDKECSPYLLQHASNPVHWLAWNEASLQQAKQSHKPILLSIGYSACHWCHVMAHESFDNPETAALMNQFFINIKVDKEERPDLDKIYQNAHSLLTERSGGWPLTIFLAPDTHMPIFAGTYFPAQEQHGLPAFKSLLSQINDIWLNRKSDIDQQSASLQSTYQRIHQSSKPSNIDLNTAIVDIARNQIEKQFDASNGGFSTAPKFPHPSIVEFSLKHWARTRKLLQPDPRILHCAIFTLEKMANGGLFDHLGGGFYRYSTDESWMIPHFEKMLYDNGPLLSLYSQAWKLNSEPLFFDAANETALWVLREMQTPEGGYYCAQDTDSEGVEGKYYVWSKAEINAQLEALSYNKKVNAQSIELFKQRFGLNLGENFTDSWHLHGYQKESTLCSTHQVDEETLHQQLRLVRQHLFEHRKKRIHPDTDTKILCAWNGLMIHGMSMAGRQLAKPEYTESAIKAAYFLKQHCWKDNRLFATAQKGDASLNAYVDDYAFLIYGLLELLQSKWDNKLYSWALQLADQLILDFEDSDYGGFYFTSHHHENLIQRIKTFSDDAIPSGNAIAAIALNRLGYLSGNSAYITATENCLKSAWSAIAHAPVSHCAMLNALAEYMSPANILIMRTVEDDEKTWQLITQEYNLLDTLVYNIPAGQTLHPSLQAKTASSTSQAYPCTAHQCQKPIKTMSELRHYLQNNSYRIKE